MYWDKFLKGFKFIFISGIGWLIDFSLFSFFINYWKGPISALNMCSSIIAATFVYFTSTYKIFKVNDSSINKKYYLYVAYQLISISIFSFFIEWLSMFLFHSQYKFVLLGPELVTKILITPLNLVTNFIFINFLLKL